ncbi:MAG: hypothetical protein WA118_04810 [Carboxydocellales bacterium]
MKIYYLNFINLLRKAILCIVIVVVFMLGIAYLQGKLDTPTLKRYDPIFQGRAWEEITSEKEFC